MSSRLLTVRRPTGGDVNALLPAGDLATGRRAGAALVRHLRHGALWAARLWPRAFGRAPLAARLWPRALGGARWRSRRIDHASASDGAVHLPTASPSPMRERAASRRDGVVRREKHPAWRGSSRSAAPREAPHRAKRRSSRGVAHRETPNPARHAPAPDTARSAMGLARLVLPPSRATPQVAVSERPRPDDRDLGKCPVDDGGFLRHSSTRQFDRGSTTRHPRSLREFLRTP